MATVDDLVVELIEQAMKGDITWEPISWQGETPERWQASAGGCKFDLIGIGGELLIYNRDIADDWVGVGCPDGPAQTSS